MKNMFVLKLPPFPSLTRQGKKVGNFKTSMHLIRSYNVSTLEKSVTNALRVRAKNLLEIHHNKKHHKPKKNEPYYGFNNHYHKDKLITNLVVSAPA